MNRGHRFIAKDPVGLNKNILCDHMNMNDAGLKISYGFQKLSLRAEEILNVVMWLGAVVHCNPE
jgi:hypothetical protein